MIFLGYSAVKPLLALVRDSSIEELAREAGTVRALHVRFCPFPCLPCHRIRNIRIRAAWPFDSIGWVAAILHHSCKTV